MPTIMLMMAQVRLKGVPGMSCDVLGMLMLLVMLVVVLVVVVLVVMLVVVVLVVMPEVLTRS